MAEEIERFLSQARPNAPAIRGFLERFPHDVLDHVATFSRTPEVLEALSTDPSVHVRCLVAGNLSTPVRLLVQFAEDQNPHLQEYAAANDALPEPNLAELAQSPHRFVRESVAGNITTPAYLLKKLAKD